jgi:NADH-quinone oxidoreductase subunit J
MSAMRIVFLLVSAITFFAAFKVVSSRRVMHAALWLVMTLMGVAILFALLETRFFAVVQLLVYIGAIAILIIFSVMLTRHVMEDVGPQVNPGWWLPLAASLGLFAVLVGALSLWQKFPTVERAVPAGGEDLQRLGMALVDPAGYVIPFEVASVLLLAALIGALVVATNHKGRKQ